MFGKRTTFGGNTPGVQEAPRPIPSAPSAVVPAPAPAARTEMVTRSYEPPAARPRSDEVVDVRSPEAAARDKEYFQTKS
ncbi:MAG TPA: hypothetical protein VIN06_06850, partial [Devosia sp.]